MKYVLTVSSRSWGGRPKEFKDEWTLFSISVESRKRVFTAGSEQEAALRLASMGLSLGKVVLSGRDGYKVYKVTEEQ